MTKANLLILLLAAVLCSCATPQQGPNAAPLATEMEYNATKDQVWTALISEIGLHYPVRAVEKSSGLVTTDFVAINAGFNNALMKNYVDPPRVFLGTWNGLRATLSALVTETESGKSHVKIQAHYEAFENNVINGWIACQSNGGLENQILKNVYAKVAHSPPSQQTAGPQ